MQTAGVTDGQLAALLVDLDCLPVCLVDLDCLRACLIALSVLVRHADKTRGGTI
eukprot:SAG22_NODE_935_length_6425_cov_10.116819_2_plen_54_part_00